MTKNDLTHTLHETLQNTFHFSQFRPGQLEALTVLMTHGQLLCIQPTGHGKSLLYQLPSVLLDGLTLVISPLLALMRDQLMQLNQRFGIAAASINTDQSEQENFAARQAAIAGKIRILFIAPEQLDHIDRLNFLLELPIKLIVIDEAHCISTWGHDFRPSYRQIIQLTRAIANKEPNLKILGLTATANKKTEEDIRQQLTLDQREVLLLRESMDRANIRLLVLPTSGITAKLDTVVQLMGMLNGTGLIYCATREHTELVAEYLQEHNISAIAYHAGFEAEQKRRIQNELIEDKYKTIVATNALGMGIDKANLRYIIHFDFPGSITAYYQEVGRSGRDGLPAEGILLYDPADQKIQNHFIESAQPSANDFQSVLNRVMNTSEPLNLTALKRLTGLHPTRLTVIVSELIEQHFLQKVSLNGVQVYQLNQNTGTPDLSRYTIQHEVRTAELHAMQQYAMLDKQCLMKCLREALGDHNATPCNKCSNCTESPFKITEHLEGINNAAAWLQKRSVPLTLAKKIRNVAPGIAVLDGKLRSREFIQFMKERATSNALTEQLLSLLKEQVADLHSRNQLSCIIPVPSTTWIARDNIAQVLAHHLCIPVFNTVLQWHTQPDARQGNLLNNDQRQHNVKQRMLAFSNTKIPPGNILLFDDYAGSGATLNEAARALRAFLGTSNLITPFTIAAIKWRLGKSGMI